MKFFKLKRQIKFWLQRRIRGWSDDELWNLDYTISQFVLPRLKAFRANPTGHPACYTSEEWEAIIDKMIRAFELSMDDSSLFSDEAKAEIDAGLKLFGENMRGLWS